MHEQLMIECARNVYKKIEKATPGTLISSFRDLCKDMSHKEALVTLLGRKSICDLKYYDNIVEKSGWVNTLNRLKHDKTKETPVSSEELNQYVKIAKELFNYFRTGKIKRDDDISFFDIEPVYPYVVSLRETHRKKDGLIIYNYILHSLDGKDDQTEINILTPREYSSTLNYYCIPVNARAMPGWLLDPFLVPCSKFDAIFR